MGSQGDFRQGVGPDVPSSYEELRRTLQQRLGSLAPGQARIARIVLGDPEGTAFRTIGDTARAAQVAESSVARFAVGLGLAGYPALVELCRQQLAQQAQLVRRFENAQEVGDRGGLLAAVVRHDQQNIGRTMAQVDPATWTEAVEALAHAPAVHVLGLRKCFTVAYLLAYLLRLVRPRVHHVAPTSGGLADELRDLTPGDVFVAVSIHRYTVDTVRALAHARARRLRTVVLTDNAASPLVAHGDLVFFVETGGVTVLRSLAAFISLVQALATAVALELGTESRSELLLDEQLLDTFGVYLMAGGEPAAADPSRATGEENDVRT